MFAGFARTHVFFKAFESEVAVSIEEVKHDEAVARQITHLQISTAVKAWNALTGAISEVKLSHRVWISGSPSAA